MRRPRQGRKAERISTPIGIAIGTVMLISGVVSIAAVATIFAADAPEPSIDNGAFAGAEVIHVVAEDSN